jgi:hypothetical protein
VCGTSLFMPIILLFSQSFLDCGVAAIHRFKVDELGVPEPQVIDDVGPQT